MTNKPQNKSNISEELADIHTHILHSLDDGSSSIDESLELLKREKSQGVTNIVLTPHFDLEKIPLEDFLRRRNEKYNELLNAVKAEPELQGLKLHIGAEVKYTPNIVNCDVKKLVIEGTNHLLLELPSIDPFYLDESLLFFSENEVTPIFAHVERCPYLLSGKKLKFYKNKGVILQSNLSALVDGVSKKFLLKMIKKGYIDILASDSHNLDSRPPLWDDALKLLNKREAEKIKINAQKLFSKD